MTRGLRGGLGAIALLAGGTATSIGQEPPTLPPPPAERAEIWSIGLGKPVSTIPKRAFIRIACGTNGGPPSRPLGSFDEFALCRPNADGLHEVTFEYSDEHEYWARAHELQQMTRRYLGTQLFGYQAIVSVLVDDGGVVRGLRAVTDPRAEDGERVRAVYFRDFAMAFLGEEGWSCEDHPAADGRQPVAGIYIHQTCTKTDEGDGRSFEIVAHHFHKPGQSLVDPHNAQVDMGNLESSARLEIRQRLTDAPSAEAFIAGRSTACEGCNLGGADLRWFDLAGAKLAGANLAGANLHGAVLTGADLTGANLASANLNRTKLQRARLVNARLPGAMLFASDLSAADLAGADLSGAMMGEALFTRTSMPGATLVEANLRLARLAGADLSGADLRGALLRNAHFAAAILRDARLDGAEMVQSEGQNADLTHATLRGADLFQADLRGADLTGADFSGARLASSKMRGAVLDGVIYDDTIMPNGRLSAAGENP